MERDGGVMMAVWVAIVMSLGIVALVVGLSVERSNFDRQVRRCVAIVEATNVRERVALDIEQSEHRVYYDRISEWDLAGDAASGIFDDRTKTCLRPRQGFREWPFQEFGHYRQTGRNGKLIASDPIYSPLTECGRAVHKFMRDYNKLMARLHPASIKTYCR